VLEHVYRLTGDKKYLEAAEKAVTYLKTLLVPQEKGHLLPVRIEHDGTYFKGNADVHSPLGDNDPDHGELPGDYTEPICYLGQCCGPFGTGRLYYSLAQDTGDDSYLDLIKDSIDGCESLGAPEHKSAGLWGVYYCCGHAKPTAVLHRPVRAIPRPRGASFESERETGSGASLEVSAKS